MGQSSATALKTDIESMKLFVVLSLASVAIGGMDYEMVQKWQKLKAMESCWGEENMKLVMVDMKKAIAKCSHEDAPELSLPPLQVRLQVHQHHDQQGRPVRADQRHGHHVRQDDVPDEEEPQLLHPIQQQLPPRKLQHGEDEDDDEDDEDEQHDERQPRLLVFFLQQRQRCL